jgi:hypothetical protein
MARDAIRVGAAVVAELEPESSEILRVELVTS